METPTIRQLEYVVALAEHGHFGRAAEAVHVSQPALSAQIRELEERLGVTLFERGRRVTRPTHAGTEVARRARGILRDLADLVGAAADGAGELTGSVRVGAIPTMAPYLFPVLTGAVRRSWPRASLELTELRTDQLVQAITDGELDLGLLATPHETASLHVSEICDEEFELALPEGHALEDADRIPLRALADLPVLLLEEGHCLRAHAMAACRVAGPVDYAEMRSASLSTVAQMAAAGVGVTLLPASAVPVETRPGSGLVTRRFQAPAPGRTIAMAWRPADPRRSHYEELAEMLGDLIGATLE